MFSPMIYTFEKGTEVYKNTKTFIESNTVLQEEVKNYFWAYNSLVDLIPQTFESFWSGNTFPLIESWEELQISFNLCSQGLYKQSMATLRNVFELNLMSVYMNISDNGHKDITQWLNSKLNTPRLNNIWEKISKHNNFKQIQKVYDLKGRMLRLNDLHNFVHTKGYEYSNNMGLKHRSNYQTFEEESFHRWFACMKEVVELSAIFHLVKYPIGIIEYDYSRKFGINAPMMGVLQEHQIVILREIIGEELVIEIEKIADNDSDIKDTMEWINSLEDKTDDDVEQQIIKREKSEIEYSGLNNWIINYNALYSTMSKETGWIERRESLKKWAKENNYIEHVMIRNALKIKELKESGYSLEEITVVLKDKHFGNLEKVYVNPHKEILKLRGMLSKIKGNTNGNSNLENCE
ncbi:hypothetical protein CEQ21_16080 [Niallia circulans]|uniref:Uncharacterized protein n=1 Tax=Niallia circulans TaxID=1397 RepID=A0A553SJ59_NIACI|nr:hypothetical protein [Niallia circulans]TRZ37012.1 hypothetical protein CEQ21_16080 [Niallia circulans]